MDTLLDAAEPAPRPEVRPRHRGSRPRPEGGRRRRPRRHRPGRHRRPLRAGRPGDARHRRAHPRHLQPRRTDARQEHVLLSEAAERAGDQSAGVVDRRVSSGRHRLPSRATCKRRGARPLTRSTAKLPFVSRETIASQVQSCTAHALCVSRETRRLRHRGEYVSRGTFAKLARLAALPRLDVSRETCRLRHASRMFHVERWSASAPADGASATSNRYRCRCQQLGGDQANCFLVCRIDTIAAAELPMNVWRRFAERLRT